MKTLLNLVDCRGPRYSSFFQTIFWLVWPTKYLQKCRDKYGSVFKLKMFFGVDFIMISDPKIVKEVALDSEGLLSAGKAQEIFAPLVGESSVFVVDDAEHRLARTVLRPGLSRSNIEKLGDGLPSILKKELSLSVSDEAQYVDLERTFTNYSATILIKLIFDIDDRDRAIEYSQTLAPLTGALSALVGFVPILKHDFGPLSPIRILWRQLEKLDLMIYSDIEKYESENSGRDGFLGCMIAERDSGKAGVSNTFIRNQIVSTMLAGIEVNAGVLAWSVYWIFSSRDNAEFIKNRVLNLEHSDPVVNEEYLDSVCNEVLRIIPTADFLPRAILEEGYEKYMLTPSTYLIHRDAELYVNPDEFLPDRFIGRKLDPYEFLPFGLGLRHCAGSHLAKMVQKKTITDLLMNSEISILDFKKIKPKRRNVIVAPSRLKVKIQY